LATVTPSAPASATARATVPRLVTFGLNLAQRGRRVTFRTAYTTPAAADAERTLLADERLLFRYSSITDNPHRIHYDVDYARSEGHPDVLVHGPLQGAWITQFFTDWAGPLGRLRRVSWQNRRSALPERDYELRGRVVLVEFPRPGIYSIGFVTSETGGEAQVKTAETVVNVFIPTTPNPTSGFLVLIPEEKVTKLDMSVADGIKYNISLGSVSPDYTPPPAVTRITT
jgi:hypothetical protein